MSYRSKTYTWNDIILVKRSMIWVFYTDGLTVPYHAQHCDGQWLILDSYCASFKLLSRDTNACIDVQLYREWHVTGCALSYCGTRVAGCALCYRVVTSHWIFNGAACYRKNLWRSCDKVISVGTPAIRHIHVKMNKVLQGNVRCPLWETFYIHIHCVGKTLSFFEGYGMWCVW